MEIKKIFIAMLIMTISCQQKQTDKKIKREEAIISMNQITTDYDTLINRIKYGGDIDAYNELFYSFMDSNESEKTDSLMIYSKIMAEKFHNERAYYDYFKALCEKYNIDIDYSNYSTINISSMDKLSKKQAKDWLKKMLNKNIITQEQFDSIKQ